MALILRGDQRGNLASMLATLSEESLRTLSDMHERLIPYIEELLAVQNTPNQYIAAKPFPTETTLCSTIWELFFKEHTDIPDALAKEIYHLHLCPIDAAPDYGKKHAFDYKRDYHLATYLSRATAETRAECSHIFARLMYGSKATEFQGDWKDVLDEYLEDGFRSAGRKERVQTKLFQAIEIVRLAENNERSPIDVYERACFLAYDKHSSFGLSEEELMQNEGIAQDMIDHISRAEGDGAASGGGGLH